MVRSSSESATDLTLRDYLDDVNDVAGVSLADMDVSIMIQKHSLIYIFHDE